MRVRLFASVAALLLVAGTAFAQSDRRDRQYPELVVESDGRLGSCDSLQFTADGKYVLAVGDDKVVRIWPYRDGKLQTGSVMQGATLDRLARTAWASAPSSRWGAVPGQGEQTRRHRRHWPTHQHRRHPRSRYRQNAVDHAVARPPRGENSNAAFGR